MIANPLPLILCACLLLPDAALGATFRQAFEMLKSDAYQVRFAGAMRIAQSQHQRTDEILSGAIRDGFFRDSAAGEKAAEFLLSYRAGADPVGKIAPENKATNIFLISIDTLRADHLSAYGYPRKTSPSIDALAAGGALFENAISTSSWTLPAHMSIFTSLYPSFHKLDMGGRLGSIRLDASETTLADILKTGGYTTVGFVAHPYLGGEWGFDRSFDFYGRFSTGAREQTERVLFWLDWHRFHISHGLAAPDFFLFLHYIDPHETYAPPPPYREKYFPSYDGPRKPSDKFVTLYRQRDFETADDFRYALALYDGEINYVDESLGRILEKLQQFGWSDSTLVIVTSDHGEEFKDHGSMGHKATLYEEQLRVPLILAHPERIAPGQRITEQVSLVDILPTVIEFAGKEPPERSQGRSLVPHLKMKDQIKRAEVPSDRCLFAELGPIGFEWEGGIYRRTIRSSRYKLIHSYLPDGTFQEELFDMLTDSKESNNCYAQRKDTPEVRDLKSRLGSFTRDGIEYNSAFRSSNEFMIDEETKERLRALGYMD
jgi:arylsulfatase A-like enzyme